MMLNCIPILVLLASATANAASDGLPASVVKKFALQHSGAQAGTVNWSGKGTGQETKLGGLDAYVAVPKKPPTAAVVLITDGFGWKNDNARLWADNLAAQGFLAVIPDFFKGNPRKKTDTPESFPTWLAQFPRQQVLSETAAVFADIRKKYPTVKEIGAQGFCWGGLYAVLLTHGKSPAVSASVVYHGSLLTKEDILAINAPINFQQSDPALDKQINTTFYKEIQGILADKKSKGLDASITNYPGMPHGFSMRGGSDANTTAAATKAFNAGVAFLKAHLY